MANPWSAFYWADYIADTGHLSLEQHGAYLLLMAHYYRTHRPLPANASVLHRVCRCTTEAEKCAVESVVGEFFYLDGDVYRHRRIEEELSKATNISEKRRAAANAKHQKDRTANALQMHPQSQSQPHPQLQPDSPAQPESDRPSPENPCFRSKEKSFSEDDFFARDLRKLSDALNKIAENSYAAVGSGVYRSQEEIFEWACDMAGISVARGLQVQEWGKKWPRGVGFSA